MQNISSSAAFADSKPHYELLDGLRGIAALLVIWYHIFEGFATSPIRLFGRRFLFYPVGIRCWLRL